MEKLLEFFLALVHHSKACTTWWRSTRDPDLSGQPSGLPEFSGTASGVPDLVSSAVSGSGESSGIMFVDTSLVEVTPTTFPKRAGSVELSGLLQEAGLSRHGLVDVSGLSSGAIDSSGVLPNLQNSVACQAE